MSVGQGGLVFVAFVCFAPLGIELLGSWSPNGAKIFMARLHSICFSRLPSDERRIGKGGTGQFAREVRGGKRLVCVRVPRRELLSGGPPAVGG